MFRRWRGAKTQAITVGAGRHTSHKISGAAGPLPDLAVAGPGHYRLRVHARTLPWDENDPDAPLEEHLLVVYPGRSTDKVVYRPRG
ncbi:hypothetical protein [Nonomuraea sp. NPDC049784]|uniref:hypothetical protein n=1 Tax=Nonomuraea sp. NPDC049784 TaxID=3154361 RepID=UPI0033E08977